MFFNLKGLLLTHMHGLAVHVKEVLPFTSFYFLFYVFDWLYFM